MPGAVGRTSTFALCNVTLPWALEIVNRGLLEAAGAGKLLITSRYPDRSARSHLEKVELRPLNETDTGKIFLRLEGFRLLELESQALIRTAVGGHPRILEYVDALLRKGESAEAVGTLKAAAIAHPDNATVRCLLGRAHAAAGNEADAIRSYTEALRIDPGNAKARDNVNRMDDR